MFKFGEKRDVQTSSSEFKRKPRLGMNFIMKDRLPTGNLMWGMDDLLLLSAAHIKLYAVEGTLFGAGK